MKDFYTHFRKHQYTTVLGLFLLLTDIGFITVISELFYRIVPHIHAISRQNFIFLSVILTLCWILANLLVAAYQVDKLGTYMKIANNFFRASVIYASLMFLFLSLISIREGIPINLSLVAELFITAIIPIVLPIVLLRCLMLRFYRFYRNLSFNHIKVVIIGYNDQAVRLYHFFVNNRSLPHKFMGFFDETGPQDVLLHATYRGNLHKVKEFCIKNDIREIYYALPNNAVYLADLAQFADEHFIYLGIVPDTSGIEFKGKRKIDTQLYDNGKIPVLSSRKVPLRLMVNSHIKRAFDIVFSFTVLLVLAVTVFPIVAIAIKLESPGPIFFTQLRPGKFNRLFKCYKFRTMRINTEIEKQATKDDMRITQNR